MSSVHESQDSARPVPSDGPGVISGTVKWFDVKKGFGFIVGPAGEDVFVHFSVIETDGFRTLKDGENVDYELHTGEKGLHAQHVHRGKPADEPPKLKATIHAKAARLAERRTGTPASTPTPTPIAGRAPARARIRATASASPTGERASLSSVVAADAMSKRRPSLDGYVG